LPLQGAQAGMESAQRNLYQKQMMYKGYENTPEGKQGLQEAQDRVTRAQTRLDGVNAQINQLKAVK
jgi:hypothetical protein